MNLRRETRGQGRRCQSPCSLVGRARMYAPGPQRRVSHLASRCAREDRTLDRTAAAAAAAAQKKKKLRTSRQYSKRFRSPQCRAARGFGSGLCLKYSSCLVCWWVMGRPQPGGGWGKKRASEKADDERDGKRTISVRARALSFAVRPSVVALIHAQALAPHSTADTRDSPLRNGPWWRTREK